MCCLKKHNVVTLELPIKKELKNCLDRFGEQNPMPRDWHKINQWKSQQLVDLNKVYSVSDAECIYTEAYLYMYQLEAWHQYIDREMKKTIRPAVKTILEKWRTPRYMLLRIEEECTDYFLASNVLTGEIIEIDKDLTLVVDEGAYIFGPFLNSSVESAFRYLHISVSVLSVSHGVPEAVWWMKSAYVKGQWKAEEAFFYDNLLICFEAMRKNDWPADVELSEKELSLLEALSDTLITMDLIFSDIVQVVEKYLQLEGYPKRMQKQEVFIAGAVLAGETLRFYELNLYRKQLVDYLGVSSSTANKYENLLIDFYVAHMKESRMPVVVFEQGTDPRASEYEQWKFMMHSNETFDFSSEQKLMEELERLKNKPYVPKNDRELVQVLAYESYRSPHKFEKIDLANQAFKLDPQNSDALLLRAEQVKDQHEQRDYLEQAIRFSEQQFDGSLDNTWIYVLNRPYMRAVFQYGIWCFEEGRYEDALKQFERLLLINPDDNQGARFLAIVCYLSLGLLDMAEQLLMQYSAEHDALTTWLEWAWLKQKGGATAKVEQAFERAVELNPFVHKYMKLQQLPLGYPKRLMMKRQSPEEGQFTWYLLSHILS